MIIILSECSNGIYETRRIKMYAGHRLKIRRWDQNRLQLLYCVVHRQSIYLDWKGLVALNPNSGLVRWIYQVRRWILILSWSGELFGLPARAPWRRDCRVGGEGRADQSPWPLRRSALACCPSRAGMLLEHKDMVIHQNFSSHTHDHVLQDTIIIISLVSKRI